MHGLWMTGAESVLLRRRLARDGYLLRVFPYSSLGEAVPAVAARCARFAAALGARHGVPVHFVGHSLGGLVVYGMFQQGEPQRCGLPLAHTRVVFLGTPVRSSRAAQRAGQTRLGRWLMGAAAAAGVELLNPVERRWHFAPPLGVISGARDHGLGRLIVRMLGPNDGTVQVAETVIAGSSDHILLPATHTGLLLAKSVARQVAEFLDTGHFSIQNLRPK